MIEPNTDETYANTDTVPFTIELGEEDTVTVTIGDEQSSQNFMLNITATDTTGNGQVSFMIDLTSLTDSSLGVSANDGTGVEPYKGGDYIAQGQVLYPQNYDVIVAPGAENYKAEGVFLADRTILRVRQGEDGGANFSPENESRTETPTETATPTETETPTETATPTETETPTETATPTETEVETHTEAGAGDDGSVEDSNEAAPDGTNSDSNSDSETETEQETDDGGGPGFGVASGIAGLAGVGYLLKRRIKCD